MLQITQKLKNGRMQILEVPIPTLQKGHILVKNHFSLISVGTEYSTVKAARKSLLGKAKERPQEFKKAIDSLKIQGISQTYRSIMKKLDSYSPLGYSCCGIVVNVASDVHNFSIGDFVACGGLSSSHSEIVSVPINLAVRLNPESDLKQAAYNTLGAISLQGVRQANLRLGETCAVVGLGLLGQITSLLLKASGIKVIGIDINTFMINNAKKNCVDFAFNRYDIGIFSQINLLTSGYGCDAVIITASSDNLDPINFSGAIARKKGTIVVVGAVPTGFDREPHFYKKELTIKMSCSYGPGRYDPGYEEKNIDYPLPYVRWTENRNMMAFQDLIYSKIIDLNYLTTHIFKLENSIDAYSMIMSKSEPYIGILIEYDAKKEHEYKKKYISSSVPENKPSSVSIGFIGAGSYAQSFLLPNIPKNKNISLKGIMTTTGTTSRSVAERFGFDFCTSDKKDIIENSDINTIFVASRHDSHGEYVIDALNAGKNVFVEKPLCLTENELVSINNLLIGRLTNQSTSNNKISPNNVNPYHPNFIVGYNRRFSPLVKTVKAIFPSGPMAMIYRINAGQIQSDSWIHDPLSGGGRIIGEVCHFVDLLTFINGSLPTSVFASVMAAPNNCNDILNVHIKYQNGSIGSISYFSNGDKSLPKEHIEIFFHGSCAIINDFKSLDIHANGKRKTTKLLSQDKGQRSEILSFIDSIIKGSNYLIPIEEIISSSFVTFKIIDSIQSGKCLDFL